MTSVGVAGRRVSYIKEASRPTWLDEGETKGDERYKLCQCCAKKFGLKTRKSHCRRCGGVMCKKCTDAMELPAMMYEGPQKVCRQCSEGQYASRHIEKIPKKDRGTPPTHTAHSAALPFFHRLESLSGVVGREQEAEGGGRCSRRGGEDDGGGHEGREGFIRRRQKEEKVA